MEDCRIANKIKYEILLLKIFKNVPNHKNELERVGKEPEVISRPTSVWSWSDV